MKPRLRPISREGSTLGTALTVLSVVDSGSVEPVYIVWNHDTWTPMACKVMLSHKAALREKALLDAVAHPNIVRAFDVHEPGLLLMPYLEGQSLRAAMDEAPRKLMRISDALRVAIHIGSALNNIHRKGWLYLDVKPENVMITPGGRPVLFDFGTAREIGKPRPAKVIGTNEYIAPEECKREQSGPAADVFSLAVMVYEMLAGTLPFPTSSPRKFSQVQAAPKSLRADRPKVSARLENLIFACLEKNPEFRPELSEVIPELNELISDGPRMWPEHFNPAQRPKARRSHLEPAPHAASFHD